ncbi:peroxiredoxin [Curtobacterium sp. ER1/6]|nr:peroxiredoxin [Curtobacterium sp. ER1/6]
MQFSAILGEAGGTVEALDVKADVSLGPDKDNGGFKLTGITLTVNGEVSGIDEAAFLKAADEAKATCPVSKALTGVDIELKATFEQ